jgi:hypothetical protein
MFCLLQQLLENKHCSLLSRPTCDRHAQNCNVQFRMYFAVAVRDQEEAVSKHKRQELFPW